MDINNPQPLSPDQLEALGRKVKRMALGLAIKYHNETWRLDAFDLEVDNE